MEGHLFESEYDLMYRRDVYLSYVYNVIKRDGQLHIDNRKKVYQRGKTVFWGGVESLVPLLHA